MRLIRCLFSFVCFETVKHLIAAVLKEKGPSGQITSSTLQVSYLVKI